MATTPKGPAPPEVQLFPRESGARQWPGVVARFGVAMRFLQSPSARRVAVRDPFLVLVCHGRHHGGRVPASTRRSPGWPIHELVSPRRKSSHPLQRTQPATAASMCVQPAQERAAPTNAPASSSCRWPSRCACSTTTHLWPLAAYLRASTRDGHRESFLGVPSCSAAAALRR